MDKKKNSMNGPAKIICFKILIVTSIFCASIVPAAHAYLDPGTGSFILQTLIAALFGALFVLKSYWVRIKSWFSGRSNTDSDAIENKTMEAADDRQKLPENSGFQRSDDREDKSDES